MQKENKQNTHKRKRDISDTKDVLDTKDVHDTKDVFDELEEPAKDAFRWLWVKGRLSNLVSFIKEKVPDYERNKKNRTDLLQDAKRVASLWSNPHLIRFVEWCQLENIRLDQNFRNDQLLEVKRKEDEKVSKEKKVLEVYHQRSKELSMQLNVILDFPEIILQTYFRNGSSSILSRLSRVVENDGSETETRPRYQINELLLKTFEQNVAHFLGFYQLPTKDQIEAAKYINQSKYKIGELEKDIQFQTIQSTKYEENGEIWELKAGWKCMFYVGSYYNQTRLKWLTDNSFLSFLSQSVQRECHFGSTVAWDIFQKIPGFCFSVGKIVFTYAFED